MGPLALLVSILLVIIIYLLAHNRQLNHGPVESEAEFWRRHGGVPRPAWKESSYYRRRD